MRQYEEPFFEIVLSIAEADFVAVPCDYFDALLYVPEYLERVYALSKEAGKKVLLFDYTDYVDKKISLPPHAILFRVSAYRHHKGEQEIIMPYFVEDMGKAFSIAAEAQEISVGFCGQSRFGNLRKKLRAWGKRMVQTIKLALSGDRQIAVHARGIFWRSKTLQILGRSRIPAHIISRPFYSLHPALIPFDKHTVRQEYIENLRTSPVALCVRGDANASQRFYETFSASRIPLFVDTDCVLPLEEIIPYDELMIRIPSTGIKMLPARLEAWAGKQNPESIIARQKRARGVYDEYLRLDAYFGKVFDRTNSPYRHLLYS